MAHKLTPEQFDALADMGADVASELISEEEALGGFLEDSTQRLKETPYDPLEEIRAEHEDFLTKLEALAVYAIATNDWNDFYAHLIEFQSQHDLHGVTGVALGEDQ